MKEIREIPINQALCRPDHLWGAERKLVLVSLLIAVMFIFLSFSLVLTLFAIVFWILTYEALRMMSKADPHMSKIYLRHIRYKGLYRSHSTPFVVNRKKYTGWSR
jgi:type IV secretion system protein TrbD